MPGIIDKKINPNICCKNKNLKKNEISIRIIRLKIII
jgi:hypothetical protein